MPPRSPLSRRLLAAADKGLLNGRVSVWGATADDDIPAGALAVVRRAPDHDALARRGVDVVTVAAQRCDTAVVCLPRSREAARDRISRAAAATDGTLLIDGQKTDGIEAALRDVKARAAKVEVVSMAHGRLIVVRGGDFADWEAGPRRLAGGWVTAPGVFRPTVPIRGRLCWQRRCPPPCRGASSIWVRAGAISLPRSCDGTA